MIRNMLLISISLTLLTTLGCKKVQKYKTRNEKVFVSYDCGIEEGCYWLISGGIFDSATNKLAERKYSYYPKNLPSTFPKNVVVNMEYIETDDTISFGCCYPERYAVVFVKRVY